jgi:hypothetical protein
VDGGVGEDAPDTGGHTHKFRCVVQDTLGIHPLLIAILYVLIAVVTVLAVSTLVSVLAIQAG